MAGADPTGRFNAANVRTALHSVMAMALPNITQDRPIFRWIVKNAFAESDPAGDPYNWQATPSPSSPAAIADLPGLNVAVTWGASEESISAVGEVEQTAVSLTVLDVDYQAMVTHGGRLPDLCLIRGIPYEIEFISGPIALFDLDTYTFHLEAVDAQGGNQ